LKGSGRHKRPKLFGFRGGCAAIMGKIIRCSAEGGGRNKKNGGGRRLEVGKETKTCKESLKQTDLEAGGPA